MVEQAEASEVKVPETKEAQAPPSVEELQTQIATLTRQVEDAKREAKSHQEYGRKTKEELERQKEVNQRITDIGDRLDVTTQMLADLIDRGAEEEPETPKKKRSEDYLARLKTSETRRKESEQEKFNRIAYEADGLVRSIGMEMDRSPELREAYIKFLRNEPDAGLEEVKRVVSEKTTKKSEEPLNEDKIARLAEEKARKILEEKGLLKTVTTEPSGGYNSFMEFEQAYVQGKISGEQYEERARKEGKL